MIFTVAYIVRPWVTDDRNRRYFLPALTVKIIGAITLGFIYQFYYNGGDTFNYHTHGSRHIWEAFIDSPPTAVKLFFADPEDVQGIHKYTKRIIFFGDPSSYAIVRTAFLFDVLTFSTYSATACLFAVFSFIGMWMFFVIFYEQYPHLNLGLAIAAFFVPSVFFWGSGVLKDTITLACLGIAVNKTYRIFIQRRFLLGHILMLALALYGLYSIKVYIFLTFLPAAILWVFLSNIYRIKNFVARLMAFPVMVGVAVGISAFAILKASEDDSRYAVSKLSQTAQITAYDIRYYTGKDAGSGYSIGELDGSIESMILLAPQAINVSLFRPYLWEASNPLMLLSALESFALLVSVLYLLFRINIRIFSIVNDPLIIFLLIFSILFAFGVGVSTFNFGTLVRYKIPMMPFFITALFLIYDRSKSLRKLAALDDTE